jgi:hypothetical protein
VHRFNKFLASLRHSRAHTLPPLLRGARGVGAFLACAVRISPSSSSLVHATVRHTGAVWTGPVSSPEPQPAKTNGTLSLSPLVAAPMPAPPSHAFPCLGLAPVQSSALHTKHLCVWPPPL